MQEVLLFLHLLTGEQNPRIQWQTLRDPKDGVIIRKLAQTFYATLDEATEFLNWAQSQLGGVYFCINETDGLGREEKNITKLRVLFADYDGTAEPNWPIAPSFRTQRDATHGHAYWLINSDEWDFTTWTMMQRRIALACGTDTQVIDPARVARMVGFKHLKNPSAPAQYRLQDGGSRKTYSRDELLNAFLLSEQDEAQLQTWMDNRNGLQTGNGYTNNPVYISKCEKWLSERALPAIDGQAGTQTLYQSVAFLHDHGISYDLACDLAWEHYNPRCEPPWGEHERKDFNSIIQRAYKYAKSEAGCKTAVGMFSGHGAVPEPVAGWEVNATVNDSPKIEVTSNPENHRLNKDEAVRLQAQLDIKSSHYDLARAFDGGMYDGMKLVRNGKTFYRYVNKRWIEVSDELVKSLVQRYYARYSPPESFTKGVFNCLCDLVTVESFENKTWLGEQHTDPRHTVAFNNCLVDFSGDTPVIYDHTHEFVNFNVLPHDYNPEARCPRFMQFLEEIWPNQPELHNQLIEWMGYQLMAGNPFQKMAVMVGASRAGKGTITKVCEALVGDENTTSSQLEEITDNSTLHSMHKASLVILPDQHDVEFSKRSKVLSTLKGITGNDKMGWHVIYKGHQSAVISAKLMMTTNNIPTFNDPSGAIVNRMLVFPFEKTFKGREDANLENVLMSEMEGITNLAISGLMRLKTNGRFTEAQAAIEEKEEIRQDMFSLSGFISEYCTLNRAGTVCTDQIFNAYRVWATANGIRNALDHRRFIAEMKNSPHRITKIRSRVEGERKYKLKGIELNSEHAFTNVTPIDRPA